MYLCVCEVSALCMIRCAVETRWKIRVVRCWIAMDSSYLSEHVCHLHLHELVTRQRVAKLAAIQCVLAGNFETCFCSTQRPPRNSKACVVQTSKWPSEAFGVGKQVVRWHKHLGGHEEGNRGVEGMNRLILQFPPKAAMRAQQDHRNGRQVSYKHTTVISHNKIIALTETCTSFIMTCCWRFRTFSIKI